MIDKSINTRFKKGQSGNPKGRPPKKASTFESEIRDLLNKKVQVNSGDGPVEFSKRQLLLEQIINGAIKGNPTMLRLAMPLLKIADEIPGFEVLPEDEETLKELIKKFDKGDDENEK